MTDSLPNRSAFDADAPPPLPDDDGRVVAVVATEGAASWASAGAVDLARAWGGRGRRVVLFDGGIERPSLHGLLGRDNDEGLTDAVVYGASVGRVARRVDGQPLFFVPAGTVVAEPGRVLEHPRWAGMCRGFLQAGATLVVFVPGAGPGAERALHDATDVVVLAGDGDDVQGVVGGHAGKVRAVLGREDGSGVDDGGAAAAAWAGPAEDADAVDAEPDDAFAVGPEVDGLVDEGVAEAATPADAGFEEDVFVLDDAPVEADPFALDEAPTDAPDDAFAADEAPSDGAESASALDEAMADADPFGGDAMPADADPFDLDVMPADAGDGVDSEEATPAAAGDAFTVGEEPPADDVLAAPHPGPTDADDLEQDVVFGLGAAAPDGFRSDDVAREDDFVGGDDLVAAADLPGDDFAGGDDLVAAADLPGDDFAADDFAGDDFAGDDFVDPLAAAGAPSPAHDGVSGDDDLSDPLAPAPKVDAEERVPTAEEIIAEAEAGEAEQAASSGPAAGAGKKGSNPVTLVVLLLILLGVVAGAWWYGFLEIPGLERPAVQALPGGTALAASPASAPARPDAPTPASYSVAIESHRDADVAWRRMGELAARLPERLWIVAPVEVDGTVYHRVLAGPAADEAAAGALAAAIAEALDADPAEWVVRATDRAFFLGMEDDRTTALDRAAGLRDDGIPAYVLSVAGPDGTVRYRVYAGAYADADEAAHLATVLQERGLTATLSERSGDVP